MALKNTSKSYGTVHKSLHWIMAIMMIGLLAIGFYMSDLPSSPDKFELYGLHKSTGIIFFFLVILRFMWRIMNPVPELPDTVKGIHRLASHLSLWTLYGAMVLMPVLGYLMSSAGGHPVDIYGIIKIPSLVEKNKELASFAREGHEILAYIWLALIGTHVSASLYHHYALKNDILKRMMPKI